MLAFPEVKALNENKAGLVGELSVATDLLRQGYEVFHALVPSSVDLVVLFQGRCLRVEVKLGHINDGQRVRHPLLKSGSDKFDVLAVVYRDGIAYHPPIFGASE